MLGIFDGVVRIGVSWCGVCDGCFKMMVGGLGVGGIIGILIMGSWNNLIICKKIC